MLARAVGDIGVELASGAAHLARLEVDTHLLRRIGFDRVHQLAHIFGRHPHAGQSHRDAVAVEDLGKRLADEALDSPAHQRLRRVLARGPTAKIGIGQQHRGTLEALLIEGMISGGAIVLENVFAQILKGHRAQIARGNDAVGVDVPTANHHGAAGHLADCT